MVPCRSNQFEGTSVTASHGIRCKRQPATDANLFDVLASRSEQDGECLIYVEQPSEERPRISYNGVMTRAYVAVYMHVHGGVTPGLNVLHTCNRSRCWNPMHLYEGTHRDNALDSIADGTHFTLRGEQHKNCRFTDKEIADMRKLFDSGAKIAHIAKLFRTDRGTMHHIVNRKTRVA